MTLLTNAFNMHVTLNAYLTIWPTVRSAGFAENGHFFCEHMNTPFLDVFVNEAMWEMTPFFNETVFQVSTLWILFW